MSSTGHSPERREGRSYGVPSRRVQVIELLTEAYASDDLEQAEFEQRIELAEQARTIEELEQLVADFPADIVQAATVPAAVGEAVQVTGEELEQEVARLDGLSAPTRLTVIGDQHIVVGPEDPRVVRSVSLLGECNVDLRGLAGASGVYLVKVAAVIGDTRIIVSRGTPVEVRLIGLVGDQKRTRRRGGLLKRLARKLGTIPEAQEQPSAPPGPTVVVTGFRLIGDTEIIEE